MKQKIIVFLFAFFVTLSCVLSSSTAKAQFDPGIKPEFYWETSSGTSVAVGQRVLIKGYFINAGNTDIPAGAVNVSLSWSSSYAVFDGYADPDTGDDIDISSAVGYTEIGHAKNFVYITCSATLEASAGTLVEVAFYVKGKAVSTSNQFLSNLEPNTDDGPPLFDQSKTVAQTIIVKTTAAPLPITLTSFIAQKQTATSALIKWNTADAKNFSHFELERSATGKQFSKIASVTFDEKKAAYSYTDENLSAGAYYYRLKMVDIDGKFENSKTLAISFDGSSAGMVCVAPNVTTGRFYVKGLTKQAVVQVTDMTGKLLQKFSIADQYTILDISSFAPGVYVVEVIQDSRFVGRYKVVKQ